MTAQTPEPSSNQAPAPDAVTTETRADGDIVTTTLHPDGSTSKVDTKLDGSNDQFVFRPDGSFQEHSFAADGTMTSEQQTAKLDNGVTRTRIDERINAAGQADPSGSSVGIHESFSDGTTVEGRIDQTDALHRTLSSDTFDAHHNLREHVVITDDASGFERISDTRIDDQGNATTTESFREATGPGFDHFGSAIDPTVASGGFLDDPPADPAVGPFIDTAAPDPQGLGNEQLSPGVSDPDINTTVADFPDPF